MTPFEYRIRVWEEVEEVYEIRRGVTFGENLADAMSHIEKYYGNNLCEVQFLAYAGTVTMKEYMSSAERRSLLTISLS